MPQVHWEQHQPLKSSPSTQIKCLFIHQPLRLGLQSPVSNGHGGRCPDAETDAPALRCLRGL
jgi:hypothetical protein